MTDIEQAGWELRLAERNLLGCEAHLDKANRDLRVAQATYWDHSRHRSMRRLHWDNYLQLFKKTRDGAKRQFDEARARVDRARKQYDEARVATDEPISDIESDKCFR